QGVTATGLSVSVGGQHALITSYSGEPSPNSSPFPIEFVEFTLPGETAGSAADVTVTTPSGSTTAQNAVQYFPATQQFSLFGADLYQGIYDSKRDLYYFTDKTAV